MAQFNEVAILQAVQTVLENDATVSTWSVEVIISDLDFIEGDPNPLGPLPRIVLKAGEARVPKGNRTTCDADVEFDIEIAVIVDDVSEDTESLEIDALNKRKDIRTALNGSSLGNLSGLLGRVYWSAAPPTSKLYLTDDGSEFAQIALLTLSGHFTEEV